MLDRRPLLTIAILTSVALGLPASADGARARNCGTLALSDGYVHVKATGPASCRTATSILPALLDGPSGCGEWSCPGVVRGWRCSNAPDSAFPRLVTCRRGKAVAAAYSFAA